MESTTNLLEWGLVVVVVSIKDVHVVQLESFKAALNTLPDVLATDQNLRVDIRLRSSADLSRNYHIFSRHAKAFEDLAQLGL
jgi:hypothetical protein